MEKNDSKLFHGEKILFVDDNVMNLKVMRMLLEDQGLMVDTASSGREALEKYLNSKEFYYEMIFMDINMYGMDGFQVTKSIRACDRADSDYVKIYAVSADITQECQDKAKHVGMNGYITKPLVYKELFSLIKGVVKNNREEGEIAMQSIHPHFLFNALNSIKCAVILQEDNAPDLIDDFSKYLRYTFKYGGKDRLVPAGKEFEHLLCYGRLQETRFEKLHLEYFIETVNFSLPPFFVEEIVSFFIQEFIMDEMCDGYLYIETEKVQKENILTVQTLSGKCSEENWNNLMRSCRKLAEIRNKAKKNGLMISVERVEQGGVCVRVKIPD